jgi:DNA polymerase I-like protein with 3'-5' exonuclease and polymerase domains
MNEATLQGLRERKPLAGLLSQYRQWAKLVGTYGIAWLI